MSDYQEAMVRIRRQLNSTEPCKHGEVWACALCFNEALAAWLEPSETAFHSVDRTETLNPPKPSDE